MTTEQPTSDAPESPERTNGGDTPKFTQSQLDAIVKERVDRANRKTQEATEKAKREAEAEALQQQGKYKELAEQLTAKVTELTPYQERVTAYDTALRPHIDARVQALPEALRDLVNVEADALTVLDTLTKLEAAARKLQPAAPEAPQPLRSTARGPMTNTAPVVGATVANEILSEKRARMGSL